MTIIQKGAVRTKFDIYKLSILLLLNNMSVLW